MSLSDQGVRGGSAIAAAKAATPLKRRADRHALREQLFRETPLQTCKRTILGIAWSLMPARIGSLPAMVRIWLADLFSRSIELPDPESPLNAGGVVGIARDLSVPTVIEGAKRGLFPLGHVGRPRWWSPEERGVVFLDEFHLPKRLRRLMRQGKYSVSFDQEFERVVTLCAGRREGHWHLTWITPQMMWAYADLFDAGIAHSIEVWNAEGELAGGGYGVAVGDVFIGESLFSLEPNTSKIAFSVMAWHLDQWGFRFMDTKILTPVTTSLGFHTIPRAAFLQELDKAIAGDGRIGRWHAEAGPEIVGNWQPGAMKRQAARTPADEADVQE